MAAVASSQDFIELIYQSGVLERSKLDAHLQPLYARGQVPGQPEQMAALLVRDGFLTTYQTKQLLAGKWRGFFILGKYKLLDLIGSGGMGKVFLCEHMHLRQLLAIKVLPATDVSTPGALERFYREARASASLNHPNIVRAYDVDRDGDLHFLVMEYVDGTDLQELVGRHGPLAVSRASNYIRQACLGLQHAHEGGWVHRDIKPGNILLDRVGVIKILDLGLARLFHNNSDNLTKQHAEGSVLGTADYIAPEQAVASHEADVRADIYSMGATFYFLLAGQPPFAEGSVAHKLIWHQMRQPKPITALRPEVPASLAAVIEKMMMKDPAQRFQVPGEVAEALSMWKDTLIPSDTEMPAFNPNLLKLGMSDPMQGMAATRTGQRSSGLIELPGGGEPPDENNDQVLGPSVPTMNLRHSGHPTPPSSPVMNSPKSPVNRPGLPGRNSLAGQGPASRVLPPTPSQLPGQNSPTNRGGTGSGSRSMPVPNFQTLPSSGPGRVTPPPPTPKPAASASPDSSRGMSRIIPTPSGDLSSGSWPQLPAATKKPTTTLAAVGSGTVPAAPGHGGSSAGKGSSLLPLLVLGLIVLVGGIAGAVVYLRNNPATSTSNSTAPTPEAGHSSASGSTPKSNGELPAGPTLFVIRDRFSPHFNDPNVTHSIREALRRAKPGDRIALIDPTIEEQVTLDATAPKGIILEGNPDGHPTNWHLPSDAPANSPLLSLDSVLGWQFRRLQLDGEYSTDTLISVSGPCPGVTFEQCELHGFRRQAIQLTNTARGLPAQPLTFNRLTVKAKYEKPTDAAFAIAGVVATGQQALDPIATQRQLLISDCLFRGKFQAILQLDGAMDTIQVVRNRIFRAEAVLSLRQFGTTPRFGVTLTNNTFGEVRRLVELDAQPEDADGPVPPGRSLLLENNLFYQTPQLVAVKGVAPARLPRGLFEKVSGCIRDNHSCLDGVGLAGLTQARVDLTVELDNDQTLLRYSSTAPLATAGPGGSPVGAPPTQ